MRNSEQRDYIKVKLNVDQMNVIQIGITLMDENGVTPEPICTWQFNFNFDIDKDTKNDNSITMLKDSGIDFQKLKRRGIPPLYFAEKVT
jgi:CCR4-NOT transcription complex subunit 7/8